MYYKCVSESIDGLFSLCASGENWVVQYKVGEFVKPKVANSKLMVFDDIVEARNFGQWCGHVYSCEVINPTKPDYLCYSLFDLEKFWERIYYKEDKHEHRDHYWD